MTPENQEQYNAIVADDEPLTIMSAIKRAMGQPDPSRYQAPVHTPEDLDAWCCEANRRQRAREIALNLHRARAMRGGT